MDSLCRRFFNKAESKTFDESAPCGVSVTTTTEDGDMSRCN